MEEDHRIFTPLGSKKNKSKKARANKREKKLADMLGAEKHAASGAFNRRGDFSLSQVLFDSKHTDGQAILISAKDLVKITSEARGQGKDPCLVITLGELPTTVSQEWALLPLDVLSDLIEALNAAKEVRSTKNSALSTDGEGIKHK